MVIPAGGALGARRARRGGAPERGLRPDRAPRRRRRALRPRPSTRAASPYRFELEVDPEVWFLEDDGYELAVFHSHPSSPPRPSRTDVENIGLWEGKPYVILSLRSGELAAWTIADDSVNGLELS